MTEEQVDALKNFIKASCDFAIIQARRPNSADIHFTHEKMQEAEVLLDTAMKPKPVQLLYPEFGACSEELRLQGKGYGRSCLICGLGPCNNLKRRVNDVK